MRDIFNTRVLTPGYLSKEKVYEARYDVHHVDGYHDG